MVEWTDDPVIWRLADRPTHINWGTAALPGFNFYTAGEGMAAEIVAIGRDAATPVRLYPPLPIGRVAEEAGDPWWYLVTRPVTTVDDRNRRVRLWQSVMNIYPDVVRELGREMPRGGSAAPKQPHSRLWHGDEYVIRRAILLSGPAPLTPLRLFITFLADAHGERGGDAGILITVVEAIARQAGAEPSAAIETLVIELLELAELGIQSFPQFAQFEPFEPLPQEAEGFIEKAERLRTETKGKDDLLGTRHLMGTLLADHEVEQFLAKRYDVNEIRRSFLRYIAGRHPEDDLDAWQKALSIMGPFGLLNKLSNDVWTVEDTLGYRAYAIAIADPILSRRAEPPLTIGIQAPWGQGKTSLMKMIQERLDPPSRERGEGDVEDVTGIVQSTYRQLLRWCRLRGKTDEVDGMLPKRSNGEMPTVWFNPLYYRESSQVWAGLAHAMLHQLVQQLPDPVEREKFWLRLQLARINVGALRRDVHRYIFARAVAWGVFWIAAGAASLNPIGMATGVGAGVLTAWIYFQRALSNRTLDRAFEKYVKAPDYQSELGVLHLVDHDLDRALRLLAGNNPIAVFVDDLDRCEPETVAKIILAINQFLSVRNRKVYFFLGMDMEMVANALEAAKGISQDDADDEAAASPLAFRRSFGWRFMDKFIQLPFVIPHLDGALAKRYAEEQIRGLAQMAVAGAPEVDDVIRRAARAESAVEIGYIAKQALSADLPAAERVKLQDAFAKKSTELMRDPESEEIQAILELAVSDLELNPRAIKRYFSLVRILRSVQIATGSVQTAGYDRKVVLRAAHLLMNWPQFVNWLRNNPELLNRGAWQPSVDIVHAAAEHCGSYGEWCATLKHLLGDDTPPYLLDVSLQRYLGKVANDPPGLKEMHAARMF